ncbi:MAG: 23S rRNA (adenine(2503)-C(2))-methyltransferase RlmN [Waddliaceae bacterium]|jgi:23S rRNA (adenine2503-C2)-methyltransferase|nr:23S rRNA (adenine(2503)-C(2))-methyltransferase RlmN [Waddliaceae bacterium]MBT3578901.1 23S rRNA (adenine(2503)-C(2))-methyltransferase RlmN [Waddliaceae bacterium]MBT4445023.1 23S rRNA (adenine(2503)-C(2))-methyltransferase RlmN [Waddliaceae bacterium]MBT6929031.1 23S rRNA (adenine(2503)-C(2))-methyltransferase RlmN [Waddliaceae bacterium]MBT7264030.1 23S rRNA (adenine(2503)-C(2))-methyltransferase RlmN [Waddliaceae bacterium]
MFSPLNLTQYQYAQKMSSLLGRGHRHASLLYREFLREGTLDGKNPAFTSATGDLLKEIVENTDTTTLSLDEKHEEGDTVKIVFKTHDDKKIESVVVPMTSGKTLCISSQVGCRMHCAFCQTGRMGLIRNLTTEEIVSQAFLAKVVYGYDIKNIVFMGMGEPFDNYDAVMQAVEVLIDQGGLAFGAKNVSVSTCGDVEGIYRFIEDAPPSLNLAVSLNAANDALRANLMPVAAKYSMAEIYRALEEYCNSAPKRKVLIGYVLIKGVNDTKEDADALAEYLRGLDVKINVIPYNDHTIKSFEAPENKAVEAFASRLHKNGYITIVRQRKGDAIMAACGQLGNKRTAL